MTEVNEEIIEQEEIIEETKPVKKVKKVIEENEPQGKTFTEDYVKSLREEAKENRLGKKALEAKLKGLIGLTDDDDLDDAKISAYQKQQTEALNNALEKANARLISAEIKSLEGYDNKLVERLLDKSALVIEDDGTVTGLKEAVEKLIEEFPQVKLNTRTPGANPPPAGTKTAQEEYEEMKKQVRANPNDSFLKQQLFLFRENLKEG